MVTRSGPDARPGTPARIWRRSRISRRRLLLLAAASLGVWLVVESRLQDYTHPRYLEMVSAARTVQAASQAVRGEKQRRGLLQPPDVDPNQTGLIGPEWSEITTTMGALAAKRTAANPDLAAVIVRMLAGIPVRPGDAAVVVVSGSFVGGNVAAIAAVEAMGLRPVVLASLGASMWGATDVQFDWLEIEAVLRSRGILRAKSLLAVLGGEGSIARGMSDAGVAALRASAARHGIPIEERGTLDELVSAVLGKALEAAGGADRIGVFVNVGGAALALGDCPESHLLPTGLVQRTPPCTGGTPGLVVRVSRLGIPAINILNLRRLAAEYGLPYDPVPLPRVGDNARVYGGVRLR